jgi:hypothetical protein
MVVYTKHLTTPLEMIGDSYRLKSSRKKKDPGTQIAHYPDR